jgi:hypothetical protein
MNFPCVSGFHPSLPSSRSQATNLQLPDKDWAYGGSYGITNVTSSKEQLLHSVYHFLQPRPVRMAMQWVRELYSLRSLAPGRTCTITAPPNSGVCPPGWYQLYILDGPTPSVSQWVRIGGDPSQLGNWPNLPGFTQPGVYSDTNKQVKHYQPRNS